MPKKFLRIVTHGVAKIELSNLPTTVAGFWALPPASGGVLLIAKNSAKLMCLYTVIQNNTDILAQHLTWLETSYELQLVNTLERNSDKQKQLSKQFLTRLQQSLTKLQAPLYDTYQLKLIKSSAVGIEFNGTVIEIYDKTNLQSEPFETSRIAINTFNHLGAYNPSKKYADYALDIQFNESLTVSPMPKLSSQAYLLMTILQDRNYQTLLFTNPHIHEFVKDLILSPFQGMPFREYLKWYDEFLAAIKSKAEKQAELCSKAFIMGNYTKAAHHAELALGNLAQVNESLVEEELVIGYYNLGSALLRQAKTVDASTHLQKAEVLCTKQGNLAFLAKVKAKLIECKQITPSSPLTFFNLPDELILNVISHLKVSDIGRFARVSGQARNLTLNPYVWQKKLRQEFTENWLPEAEKTYRKQYREKHQQLPNDLSKRDVDTQLILALTMGAEVWAKKLLQVGATLDLNANALAKILKNKNETIAKLMLQNGLEVNKPILNYISQPSFSIFHMVVFLAPELLPLLLSSTSKITILPKLHIAVLQNDVQTIQMLLSNAKSIDINERDICNCTALWWALLLNNYAIASMLLDKGASIKAIGQTSTALAMEGHDILEELIRRNNVRCLELALKKGLSPNTFSVAQATYKTLLVVATEYGQKDMVQLLLKYGATINPELDDNELNDLYRSLGHFCESIQLNAIATAAKHNHIDCLTLLANLVDINETGITYSSKDHKHFFINRYTPLIAAVAELAEQAVKLLLAQGADLDQKGLWSAYEYGEPDDRPIYPLDALSKAFPIALQQELAQTNYQPHHANAKMTQCWFRILTCLLKQGADPNRLGKDESFVLNLIKNPIYISERKSEFEGSVITYSQKKLGTTNQQRFLIEALRILVTHKANLAQQDDAGKSILHYAAENNYLDMVRYLVEELKFDLNLKDKQGQTAIFLAARVGNEAVFRYLRQAGNDIDTCNDQQETPKQLIAESFMKKLRL